MNYYELLGVSQKASKAEIKLAYRKKVLIHHPDVKGGSAEKFIQIQTAYEVLSDESKRLSYDVKITLAQYKRADPWAASEAAKKAAQAKYNYSPPRYTKRKSFTIKLKGRHANRSNPALVEQQSLVDMLRDAARFYDGYDDTATDVLNSLVDVIADWDLGQRIW